MSISTVHRALLIAPDLPWPQARHGAAQRTELIRRALSRFCHTDLVVACISSSDAVAPQPHITRVFLEDSPGQVTPTKAITRLGRSLESNRDRIRKYYSVNEPLANWIAATASSRSYDIVVVRYLRTGAISGLLQGQSPVPVMLDFDDVDWVKEASRIRHASKGLKQRLGMAVQNRYREAVCRKLAGRCSHIWTASRDEAETILPLRAEVLPNIPMSLAEVRDPPDGRDEIVLFVGLLNYEPNREGLDWFIQEVWQRVILESPDARLRIVGKGLDKKFASRWEAVPGVEILGFVPDLSGEYLRCSATICPVFWGGGSNIKVLESLGYGRPCVVSRRVGDQFKADLGHQTGVYSCDDANAFLRHVLHLLKPSAASAAAVARGMKIVSEEFSFDRFAAIVERDVRRVLRAGSEVSR